MTRRNAMPSKLPAPAPRSLRADQLAAVQGGAGTPSYAAGKYGVDACDYDGSIKS
jgi:hypothetical protein